jgi:hypothetical protein
MESQFYVLLSLKTPAGFITYGQYELGNEQEAAYDLFDQLKGDDQIPEYSLLHIDLMEMKNGLPVKIKTISCTLDELSLNSKIIAKTVFRLNNLKEFEE